MATVVKLLGNTGGYGSRQRKYGVWGVAGELAAILATGAAIEAELGYGSLLDGLVLRDIAYDEQTAEGVYECTASWGMAAPPEPPQTSSFAVSFDFSTVQQKILLPVNPILVYDESGAVEDHGVELIGDDGKGAAEGVEIPEPSLAISHTYYLPPETVTNAYIAALNGLVGRVNNATFKGFAAGTLLSTGVSGARRSVIDDWELQFKFQARENKVNLVIGGITIPLKKGWDFVWPRVGVKLDATVKGLKRSVKQIALTSPIEAVDYSGFGIGTT